MRRRAVIAGFGAVMILPSWARAEQLKPVRRVGVLGSGSPANTELTLEPLVEGLRELGYIRAKDYVLDVRAADGRYDRLPSLAAELVQLHPDVIVSPSATAVRVLQEATRTVPIVMGYASDPVGRGFINSLAHPGGNITGLASSADDTAPKRLQLLALGVPGLSHVGGLGNPESDSQAVFRNTVAAAERSGFTVSQLSATNVTQIEQAFAELAARKVGAVVVVPNSIFNIHRKSIAELAVRLRLPTMFAERRFVEAGGLMSYGQDTRDFFHRTATYVARILEGANPGDLPVEQPTRFFLTLNITTSKALGLELPPALLSLADEVIE